MSKNLLALALCLSSLALASCGTPKKSPDSAAGTNGQDQANNPGRVETPTEKFSRDCDERHGHLIYSGSACRFESVRFHLEDAPSWDGKPLQPPYDLHVGLVGTSAKATTWLKDGKIQLWEKNSGKNVSMLPWAGELPLGSGDYWITVKSNSLSGVYMVFEVCQDRRYVAFDCDVAPTP